MCWHPACLLYWKNTNSGCHTFVCVCVLVCLCVLFWELMHSLLSTLNFKFVCCTVSSVISSSVFQSAGVPLREMSKNFFFSTEILHTLVPGCFAEMPIKTANLRGYVSLECTAELLNKTEATAIIAGNNSFISITAESLLCCTEPQSGQY